jgi:hypothetical protein
VDYLLGGSADASPAEVTRAEELIFLGGKVREGARSGIGVDRGEER